MTRETPLRIALFGWQGRMGQMIRAAAQDRTDCRLIAGGVRFGSHRESEGPYPFLSDDPQEVLEKAEVAIEFSIREAAIKHVQVAAESNIPMVIGTTGFDADEHHRIAKAAKKIPIVLAPNTSLGVNLLLSLVENAARIIEAQLGKDADCDIFDRHHRHKVDAPSGTALALANTVMAGRGRSFNLKEDGSFYTPDHGPRVPGNIGFSVSRISDVVGEHTVSFGWAGERVELSHKSSSRLIFAEGALKAALWVHGKSPGLYTMQDVLGV